MRLPLLGLSALLLLLAAACGSAGGESAEPLTFEDVANRGPYGVGVTTIELVDTSRPTEPNGAYPGEDVRTLVVEVWYPAEATAQAPEETHAALLPDDGPYPLIVFAHGLTGVRRQSPSYTQHLASHGYVVAAPDFPLSNAGAPGGPKLSAVVHQPGDVSFVIDSMLAFDTEAESMFEGAIDEERIGLTGHSLGALTTFLTMQGDLVDDRIDAAVPISLPGCFIGDSAETAMPALFIVGREDQITAAAGSHRVYGFISAPKYHVELAGADHIRFADVDVKDRDILGEVQGLLSEAGAGETAEDVVDAVSGGSDACRPPEVLGDATEGERQRELLRAFATPFFDAYLRDNDDARTFLEEELAALAPEATMEFVLE